jgi:hypothetical protein
MYEYYTTPRKIYSYRGVFASFVLITDRLLSTVLPMTLVLIMQITKHRDEMCHYLIGSAGVVS